MRIALGIEYNGHGFYGWQAQQGLPTVEATLETAISKVANEPVKLFCAGRTDANVHASAQVVHFDTHAKRHIDAWIWGCNSYLPPSIWFDGQRWIIVFMQDSGHCRRYYHLQSSIRPALLCHRVTAISPILTDEECRKISPW